MHRRPLPLLLPLLLGLAFTLPSHRPARGAEPWFLDLAADTHRQVVVDREPGQYLGHPTTLLLEDGHTILCVYPKGHGRGAIQYQRSPDGGRTWSGRLPVPASWATSQETPTIHRVIDPTGHRRLVLFSGLHPVRSALSDDDGQHWTELAPIGNWGGIVAMASVVPAQRPGEYLALFHDDGRFFHPTPRPTRPVTFTLFGSRSTDGGQTWALPEPILARSDLHLCEPGAVKSPDGREWAVLLRENRRVKSSYLITSTDEGRTWSPPRELPAALTGDRHTARYTRDGRLFISFRDMAAGSATYGDWVAWVGRYQDLIQGAPGQYRVRLMDNRKGTDCAYPGVEVLPDDTLVTTTYGHWQEGQEPYIVSVRLKLTELDALAAGPMPSSPRRPAILSAMESILGPLPTDPARRGPLEVQVLTETDAGDHLRRELTYQSEPGNRVPAYLLIPKSVLQSGARSAPGVLALHQTHAAGRKVVVGLGNSPDDEYGVELVRRGYVVLAPPYPHLADYAPDLAGLGYASGTMKAVWDNVRGLDLLASLPYVKTNGFAVIGHSLGGHNGLFTAVFDPRLKVVVTSCGFDSFRDYYDGKPEVWQSGRGWCQDRYMPRLAAYRNRLAELPFDFPDVLEAIAPRVVFVNAPLGDDNFRWRSVDRVIGAARPAYEALGSAANLEVHHPDSRHRFPPELRTQAYRRIDAALGHAVGP
jgi:hypothetical protein